MDFRSDNVAGAVPEIMAALNEANRGPASAYGDDEWSRRLDAAFATVFETECRVFPVATGTAANVLSLSSVTPGHGAIFCHPDRHIAAAESSSKIRRRSGRARVCKSV